MDWQAGRLESGLRNEAPWVGLLEKFPELRDVCGAFRALRSESLGAIQARLIDLYSRHCAEWARFPARERLEMERKVA
jgi:hypothetical protein